MKNVYIYGAGQTGCAVYQNIKNKYEVLGFLDGNSSKWGQMVNGKPIFGGLEYIKDRDYDLIFIGSFLWQDIKNELLRNGVEENKIVIDLPESLISTARAAFVKSYSALVNEKWKNFAVAEGGCTGEIFHV